MILSLIITSVSFFIMGYSVKMFIDDYKNIKKLNLYRDSTREVFDEFNELLLSGDTFFANRVNDNIQLSYISEGKNFDVLFLMDKSVIILIDRIDNKEYGSNAMEDSAYELVLMNNIKKIHGSDIDDIVELNGIIYSRQVIQNSIRDITATIDDSFIDEVLNNVNDKPLDIEVIFDKISAEGIDSLTTEERAFLDDYSKNI